MGGLQETHRHVLQNEIAIVTGFECFQSVIEVLLRFLKCFRHRWGLGKEFFEEFLGNACVFCA